MAQTRSESTRSALIEAAERLFGTKGIDRVSTREILELAGQKNQSALQYHFGDRAGLVTAVMEARLIEIEEARKALVSALPPMGEESPEQIVEALARPLADLVLRGERGSAYVQFAVQAAFHPDFDNIEVIEAGHLKALKEISDRVDHMLREMPEVERRFRKRMLIDSVLGAAALWDSRCREEMTADVFVATVVQTHSNLLVPTR